MLGVGGLSFSRGMGMSMETRGLTEKAGSRNDSLNFPFTLIPLEKKHDREIKRQKCIKIPLINETPKLEYLRLGTYLQALITSVAVLLMPILESGILCPSTSEMLNVCLPALSTLIKRIFSSLDKPMDNAFSFSGSTGDEQGGLLAGVDADNLDVLIVMVDAELEVLVFVFPAAEDIRFSNSTTLSFFAVNIFPSAFSVSIFSLWMPLPFGV